MSAAEGIKPTAIRLRAQHLAAELSASARTNNLHKSQILVMLKCFCPC